VLTLDAIREDVEPQLSALMATERAIGCPISRASRGIGRPPGTHDRVAVEPPPAIGLVAPARDLLPRVRIEGSLIDRPLAQSLIAIRLADH
jgi:hypothetical protein